MTKGSIDINVSGGNVNFGAIAQGNANRIEIGALSIDAATDRAFDDVIASLEERRTRKPDQQAEIDSLKAELAALQEALKTSKQTRWGSIADTAKILYEKYGWAGGLLKKLFVVIVPGWIS